MLPVTRIRYAAAAALLSAVAVCVAAPPSAPSNAPLAVPSSGRITEEYVRSIGRIAYLWGWPMVNLHNRSATFKDVPEPGLMGGIVPVAPLNQLAMLRDYIEPQERLVACPNQDVVYGFGMLALDREPMVIQVPDFKGRFWVYQLGDQRTDGFAGLGAMYGSKPGLYLVVGPAWKGAKPKGIVKVFRSPTNLAYMIPRVFVSDDPTDKQAVQAVINQIAIYPLSKQTGRMQTRDWAQLPKFPAASQSEEETRWVVPEKFFDVLPQVLDEVPPLPGEEALYANLRTVLAAAAKNPKLKEALKQVAIDADEELVAPLFQFNNYGVPLPDNWSTINNGAAFGVDYFTRAAVAKSNIFVNKNAETKYFYQDLDSSGERLTGYERYTVTFARGQLPPVKGFWSLTLYNEHHFFSPNALKRYSLGTKNKDLKYNEDGSLTLYVQAEAPAEDKRSNWLPAPESDFSLYLRAYWPQAPILGGAWTPPPVVRLE
ncbi:MAG TPA: DUF1254 domain-containing protein [Burkholderiales bacterium]|nr:DUF1254 domain-containing protein [Burkholderiales bacterium]